MKTTKAFYVAALALATFSMYSTSAQAQTENVTASVQVQNTMTITEVDPLNFGQVVAISDGTDTATLAIDATTDALLATTTGAPALFAIIDDATATAAQLTVEDAADTATINIEIDNVVNPTFGGNAFTLNGFETSWNGGATTARTAGTPFTYVYSAAFGGGANTLDIGAALVTQVAVATYGNGTYTGNFDVIFSY